MLFRSNEYRDRPFGLKWGTAFAMEELVNGIKKNEEEARKQPLPKIGRASCRERV
nr:hypothetical protein [Enterococcus faecium]